MPKYVGDRAVAWMLKVKYHETTDENIKAAVHHWAEKTLNAIRLIIDNPNGERASNMKVYFKLLKNSKFCDNLTNYAYSLSGDGVMRKLTFEL